MYDLHTRTQARFNEYHESQGSHDEVCTDGSNINERVGAGAVFNCHVQNGETTCRQVSKRLPDNSTIFAAEATAITLALNYYRHKDPVHHDAVVYYNSTSCWQDTENPFICHIMNLLWSLSDKGTRVRFFRIPSHCGIKGNKRLGQLAKHFPFNPIQYVDKIRYILPNISHNSSVSASTTSKWQILPATFQER